MKKIKAQAVGSQVVLRFSEKHLARPNTLVLTEGEAFDFMISLLEEHSSARTYGEYVERMDRGPA